ncbi:RNA-guided endonuclease IscB [Streptomyces endophyticus]|uniref:RNA-guided endonuclease IscB n=1 Tax=Streptomyces endophyticus TaxID=714166 RepID=A0ABU6EX16_9ACTN|nr:RNA-guided endonuclease IscB [Streptomyces endophyticus]MEB8336296.1 RNA-guided endonuclease IscB [Streptomyces endophyticus]
MVPFSSSEKTHPSVLPQRRALESVAADTPGSRHETGHGLSASEPGTGAEHGRGETLGGSPAAERVTANLSVGEKARERHPAVFVLDKRGHALQPTTPARARKLLRVGRAVVARHTPFVIRLRDRAAAESQVDGVELGIDPGSKHTGIAVFTERAGERRGRYALQLEHRGSQIRKKLGQRAVYRRGRRSRSLRYRSPRFSNRSRPAGRLAPSLQHRVDTVSSWTERLTRWAPVRAVHIERVAFDTHALSAGVPLEGVDYQHGTLAGTEAREYLLAKWQRRCAYCGIDGVPLNIDHIHPRSKGGTDRIANLTLACVPCNQGKGNRLVEEFVKDEAHLAQILAQARRPLRDVAAVNATRWALWRELDNRLPKSHSLDALAVGNLRTVTECVTSVLIVHCTGRSTYARTRPDKHGFPRLRLPRQKRVFGYATGDLARAVVPKGKNAGTHTGRVAVRATGRFNITTSHGIVQSIHHRHVRLTNERTATATPPAPKQHPGLMDTAHSARKSPHDHAIRPTEEPARPGLRTDPAPHALPGLLRALPRRHQEHVDGGGGRPPLGRHRPREAVAG